MPHTAIRESDKKLRIAPVKRRSTQDLSQFSPAKSPHISTIYGEDRLYIPTDESLRPLEPADTPPHRYQSTADSDSHHIQSMVVKKKYTQPSSTPSQSSPVTAHTVLRLSDKPKFHQVRRLKSEGRTLRIIERVSPEWKDLAYSLYFSRSAVKAVAEENPGDSVSCCEEVVDRWLDGEEGTRKPVSWATLVEAVRECEDMDTLATDIENILS